MKLTLTLYKWNPGPLNLLINQIKTCFPAHEVTLFFYFALGFLKQKMARKTMPNISLILLTSSFLKPISISTGGSKNHSSTVLR